jgi:hypothetical protein
VGGRWNQTGALAFVGALRSVRQQGYRTWLSKPSVEYLNVSSVPYRECNTDQGTAFCSPFSPAFVHRTGRLNRGFRLSKMRASSSASHAMKFNNARRRAPSVRLLNLE